MSDSVYCYPPDFTVLKNQFGIRDAALLARAERNAVQARIEQGSPGGDFDMAHLRAIHRHLFQDIYDWAGEVRTVEISKGEETFQFRRFIETGMADVHKRLVEANYLQGLEVAEFARRAGEIIGDVNYVHPFREGNGRTQLQYLKQLAHRAGHGLDLTRLAPPPWLEASRQAHLGRYGPMSSCIEAAIAGAE